MSFMKATWLTDHFVPSNLSSAVKQSAQQVELLKWRRSLLMATLKGSVCEVSVPFVTHNSHGVRIACVGKHSFLASSLTSSRHISWNKTVTEGILQHTGLWS